MHRRLVEPRVRALLREMPAVAIIGPRQCGKTTLARVLGGEYFDLEQESERLRLDIMWPDLTRGRKMIVLDEAQSHGSIFARIRGAIDESRKRCGRFLLLGSVAPALMTRVSESLAGRLALIELTPFLRGEVPTKAARHRHFLVGGYPDGGLLAPRHYPRWQDDYLTLLTQRDLPAWGLPARPQVTRRLLQMICAWNGQMWNGSRIGKSLGLNYQTVNKYIDYLEGAFLIRRLPPLLPNIAKRIVKAPKTFLRDSGVLHASLGVTTKKQLWVQPWVGASWEGFVLDQILGTLSAYGMKHDAFHFRTSDGYELDLVLQVGSELWAIETKLTTNPDPRAMARLEKVADMIGADRRILISNAREVVEFGQVLSCNLDHFLESLG